MLVFPSKIVDRAELAKVLELSCDCNGCTTNGKFFETCFRLEQVLANLEGFYWSGGARNFFKARPTGWRYMRENGGVMVLGTKANSAGERVGDFSTHCKYGHLVESMGDVFPGVDLSPAQLRKHTKNNEWMGERVRAVSECACHGCSIDREL